MLYNDLFNANFSVILEVLYTLMIYSIKKLYITDFTTGYTYYGEVLFFTNTGNVIKATLQNVDIYEYSSSNYLHSIPEIKLSGIANNFHIEENL